jgi:hypothetical protein
MDAVNEAIVPTKENKSLYLVASLRGADAGTEDPSDPNPIPTVAPTQAAHSSSDPSQSLAMIILYVIVSLVSTLFLIVIISGVS